jgi:hypothetical protein
MKKVVKEEKREYIEHITIYVANDGTEFTCEAECHQYEESALGVLYGKLKEITIAEEVSYEADDGSDNLYNCIVPQTQEHLDVMNQICAILDPEQTSKLPIFTELRVPYLVGYRFCGGKFDWIWFYDLNKIVKDVTKDKFNIEHI